MRNTVLKHFEAIWDGGELVFVIAVVVAVALLFSYSDSLYQSQEKHNGTPVAIDRSTSQPSLETTEKRERYRCISKNGFMYSAPSEADLQGVCSP